MSIMKSIWPRRAEQRSLKMKKLLGSILAVFAMASVGQAENVVYSGVMVSTNGSVTETAKASTQTYTLDVNSSGGDRISLQVAYSSPTIAGFNITDGSVSSFTVTIVSTGALAGANATNTLTVATNTWLTPTVATATISVNLNNALALAGSTIVVNGVQLKYGRDYFLGSSSNTTAVIISTAINAMVPNVFAYVSVGGSSVTVVLESSGSFGNAYTIGSSTASTLNVTGFNYGNDYASFTLNGSVYTNGTNWFSTSFASNTALAIVNVINGDRTDVLASTSAATVVTFTAVSTGTAGNSFTLTSSTAALPAGAATFSGGRNNGTLGINNIFLTAGTDFAIGASTRNAAINLAAAITADARLNTVIVASATSVAGANWGVVWTTSIVVGTVSNYVTYTSTQDVMKITPFTSSSAVTGAATGAMLGGTNSAYSLATPTIITKTAHGLTTGYGVILGTAANAAVPSPLAFGTTYFAIRSTADNFSLATTFANALAGTAITLTSSRTAVTANTFTIGTQNLAGNAVFQPQASDDGLNWNNIVTGNYAATIAAATFVSAYTAASTLWDFGIFDHRYLRLLFMGPTTGGVAFTATINQKNNK